MGDGWQYLILFLVGGIAGTLNVIAGGGSFLTLPVLIFMGLPASVANGTNRIGVMVQNVGAVWGFHRYRVLDWRSFLWAGLPASLGSILGTMAALVVSDEAFQRILAFLMVVVALASLFGTSSRPRARTSPDGSKLALATAFFLVGIYGGFVQAGIGFFILAVTSFAGLDLIRGNAVKVFSILVLTLVSLLIFVGAGRIAWVPGLVLAAGNFVGGLIGVRLNIVKGHAWVRRVLIAAILIFAAKLWLTD